MQNYLSEFYLDYTRCYLQNFEYFYQFKGKRIISSWNFYFFKFWANYFWSWLWVESFVWGKAVAVLDFYQIGLNNLSYVQDDIGHNQLNSEWKFYHLQHEISLFRNCQFFLLNIPLILIESHQDFSLFSDLMTDFYFSL